MRPPTTIDTQPTPRTPTPKKRKMSNEDRLGDEGIHRSEGPEKGSPSKPRAEGSRRASTGSAPASDAKKTDSKGRGKSRNEGQGQGRGSLKQGIDRIFGKK